MPKPAPAAVKAKDPKPAGVAAAMPPRQVLSLQGVATSLPQIKLQNIGVGGGPESRLNGTAAALAVAVQHNEAMAPERVVRQRVIPGWSGPGAGQAVKTGSALEQQRALVAALKAEAKAAAGRGNAKVAAVPTAGGVRGATAAAGGARTAVRGGADSNGDDEGDWRSEESGVQPTPREGGTSPSGSANGRLTPGSQDFALACEDFPSFKCPMPAPYDTPAPQPVQAGCTAAAEEAGSEDADPVVAHVPVWATEDGTLVVAGADGSYVRMEDVYGAAPELTGYMDEQGSLAYYVVIRQSHAAHLEQLAAEQQQLLLGAGAGVDADASAALGVAVELEVPHLPSSRTASSGDSPWSAPPDGQRLPDQGSTEGGAAGQGPHGLQPQALKQLLAAAEHQQAQPGGGGGGDLDDLLALCMGGGGATASAMDFGDAVQYTSLSAAAVLTFDATAAAAPATHKGGTACAVQQQQQQPEGEDLDDLMQLLCV
ncbi:hypothetical protein TSOC_007742 [Tetrabaena socialis]|uniref:Uncharacterized protein n=1 Tax=Tetrabaena socialis TaxID=47790 RepID=A0A2J8A0B1_9CHLO|nr:hypothetical protein TSOC_007742 [Tetrabaena socialis]|eukprot:PNH05954.1 hypothetical protein TSOC_007742 [Tetrabaena socialis]